MKHLKIILQNMDREENLNNANVEGKKRGTTLADHSVLSILRSYEKTLKAIVEERKEKGTIGKTLGNHTV